MSRPLPSDSDSFSFLHSMIHLSCYLIIHCVANYVHKVFVKVRVSVIVWSSKWKEFPYRSSIFITPECLSFLSMSRKSAIYYSLLRTQYWYLGVKEKYLFTVCRNTAGSIFDVSLLCFRLNHITLKNWCKCILGAARNLMGRIIQSIWLSIAWDMQLIASSTKEIYS